MNRLLLRTAICLSWVIVTCFSLARDDGPAPLKSPFTPEEAIRQQEAWGKREGLSVRVSGESGIKLILIPPGEFAMGVPRPRDVNSESWDAHPEHRVRITKAF